MPRLIFLAAEDWSFLGHRLPMARAARDAGFEVGVITRINSRANREAIAAEGFQIYPLNWHRRSINPFVAFKEIHAIAAIYRAVKPDIVHHIALKPIIWGTLAAMQANVKHIVNAPTGLGYVFTSNDFLAVVLRLIVAPLLRLTMRHSRVWTVLENSDDLNDLINSRMIDAARANLIRGCGIELDSHHVLAEPTGPVTVGVAARMLHDKGIMPLVSAQQKLQSEGMAVHLLLAGTPDPENRATLTAEEMTQIAALPGVTALGQVADIRTLWAQCHIAALPSRREGLPKALLEAAAAGRPIIATNVPGCREVCHDDVNGLLVPVDDAGALAAAIKILATDPALRAQYGAASRRMVEGDLSATAVGEKLVALYRRILAG